MALTAALPSRPTMRIAADEALHPGAWWLWALGLAVAAARTTNPLLLGLIIAVAAVVVAGCRQETSPWGRAFATFAKIGVVVIAITLLLRLLLGPGGAGTVVVRLPAVPLPGWLAGLHLGGPVRSGPLLASGYQALQVAAAFCCLGAANAVSSPLRLLRSLPAALYEAGLVVTVALTFAPQAVAASGRIHTARRLRGRPTRGLAAVRGLAIPVLTDALDRSLSLAAAMDSRGYGRRGERGQRQRRLVAALTLAGLVCCAAGCYGVLSAAAPAAFGPGFLGAGAAALVTGLTLAGRHGGRSRYRPTRFGTRGLLVAGSGIVASLGMLSGTGLHPVTEPPAVPGLPWLAAATVLLALLPALLAPAPRIDAAPRSDPAPVAAVLRKPL